ncbi:MAG: M81 family metallopeptidase, partial [Planctomycetes bacterium]|nr:M81 family metallopeptidase [Planctomycetota bacterium]
PDLPIVMVMDPHGNLSPRMVAATDAAIAYRTNPHLDQRDRGLDAAELMARTLAGTIRPVQAASYPPLALSIDRQATTEPHCQRVLARIDALRARHPAILSCSFLFGFPYADVEEMGASFIVVTDGEPTLARRCADELADDLIAHRDDFLTVRLGVAEAVDEALRSPGPVGLLDMGDNVGAGAPADGTIIAHELHRRAAAPSFVCLHDSAAAERATAAGLGARVQLSMGGRTDDRHGAPLNAEVTVLRFSDGNFREPGIVHGGRSEFAMGPVATVRTDSGITINLTRKAVPPFSIGTMTSCGLDPRSFQIIVAKGVQSPVPALQPYCSKLLRVNTPGSTSADLAHFTYRHRRRPMFPFEDLGAR